ncbi:uncharacterized protein LOC123011501 [Tribolium madens]|uniref:uncharacterized protein LOC123011501 n=1 Tax=Tribolium madens TaxID=41895 RepID=UPI001CF72AB6|nr:uncharacterized protein LOC123011501 [Tribolium madens]
MAFGKPIDIKRIKNAVLEDKLWKTYIDSEEKTNQNWNNRWKWILEEYDNLHQKLDEISKDSAFLSGVNKNLREKDQRTIRPIPETTNHEYGWLPNKSEFQLEKYGPDVDHAAPLPPNCGIFKG